MGPTLEDDELSSLLSKEEQNQLYASLQNDGSLAGVRSEAVPKACRSDNTSDLPQHHVGSWIMTSRQT